MGVHGEMAFYLIYTQILSHQIPRSLPVREEGKGGGGGRGEREIEEEEGEGNWGGRGEKGEGD